jgi:hypothetical protein
VSGFGFRVSGFGFRVSGFGFRVSGFEIRVSDFGFRVSGFGFRVSGFGFRGWVPWRIPVSGGVLTPPVEVVRFRVWGVGDEVWGAGVGLAFRV